MPIEYLKKAYGCQYKCGRKHTEHKAWMDEHEQKCFYNPANRTCRTCSHSSFDRDDYKYIVCDVYTGDELMEWQDEHLARFEEETRYYLPKTNCELWNAANPKEDTPNEPST